MQSAQSTFDPSVLLDTEYSSDLNTRLTPIPEGEFYAKVKSIAVRQAKSKEGNPFTVADITFIVDDEEVRRVTSMKEPQCRMSIFLDMTEDGRLQTKDDNPNANVRLGKLKEALGFKPGRKWSFRSMEGNYCWIKTKQTVDSEDIEVVYSNIVAVSKDRSKAAA